MNVEEMKKFCGTEARVVEIRQPFSRGDFTYAANGHIMIRVPRLADVGEVERAPCAEKLFDGAPLIELGPLPTMTLPPQETEECPACTEGENIHDCPNCTCSCETCDDKGEIEVQVSCEVNGGNFATKYIQMIQALPGLLFPVQPPNRAAARFTFAVNGEGLLMPLAGTYSKHVKADGTIVSIDEDEG